MFGVPVGRFTFVQSVIIAVAAGFLSFFAINFLSIIGVAIYKGITGSAVTLAISYKYIAFPAAMLVMAASLAFFMGLWVRNKFRA